jgi:hypothetical protein
MTDAARAEWLARAVSGLLRGHHPPRAPAGENAAELETLVQAARARLEISLLAANCGRQYQGAVWQELMNRLQAGVGSSEEQDSLSTVFGLRAGLADRSSQVAETRRNAIWKKLSGRLAHKTPEKGISAFVKRVRRSGDGAGKDKPVRSSMDPYVPPYALFPHISGRALSTARERVWARIAVSAEIERSITAPASRPAPHRVFGRLAVAAAGLALLVAALGPVPVTGLAGHPAVRAVDGINRQIVRSDEAPPLTLLPEPQRVAGRPMTVSEASERMGVRLSYPAPAEGFEVISSTYYAADESDSGVLVTQLISDEGSIAIQQEPTPAEGLAAGQPSDSMKLTDGTPAALIDGAWVFEEDRLAWSVGSGQSLVFDRAGVRTVISADGIDDAEALIMFADRMR